MEPEGFNALTHEIIGSAIEVHRALGPGLLESVYETCLAHELGLRGILFARQVQVPVSYKGIKIDSGLRLDLIVADTIIVEAKAVENVHPVHEAQLLSYLKLSGLKLGLLINFNIPVIRSGIKRIALNL